MAETPPVTPPVSTPALQVSPSASTGLTNLPVQKSPPQAQIQQGQTVEGRVISSNPQTQELRIQTPQGEITFKTAMRLAPDVNVSIRFYMDRGQMVADIALLRSPPPSAEAAVKITQPLPAAPPPALRPGQQVQALVLPPIPTGAPLPSIAGAQISAAANPGILRQILSAYQPRSMGEKTPITTPEGAEIDAPEPETTRISNTPSPLPKTSHPREGKFTPIPSLIEPLLAAVEEMQPETEMPATQKLPPALRHFFETDEIARAVRQIEILKILPQHATQAQIHEALKALGNNKALTAKVETVTPNGFPVLKTETGVYILQESADVPSGSIILFTARPLPPETLAKAAQMGNIAASDFNPALTTDWPALDEALNTLRQTAPAVAQALTRALPGPTAHLAPAALFFMAALRLGAVENWLGDNTLKALRAAGKQTLVDRLAGDFGKLAAQSQDAPSGEWKSISMPFLHDEHISRLQFFVRRQNDQGGSNEETARGAETRFILNLHLSRMGDMQMDGFLRQKTFDMILRTEDKLPAQMRHEISRHFNQGIEHVNLQGSLSFQSKRQGWVTVKAANESPIITA